jgi:mono/diheme cytochrome c family protein
MRTTTAFPAALAASGALALTMTGRAPRDDIATAEAHPAPTSDRVARSEIPAGAPLPTGASLGAMSDLYAHPRRGPTAAAGASSWVEPSPSPAFVISTPLPPADPPAPPPAAVANRQSAPSSLPPMPAPAPAATPPPARVVGIDLARGRQLFGSYGCGGCHALAAAGGSGGIGPALDGNARLTQAYVHGAIAEGRGAMPAYAGQMSADEIAALSAYIVEVARQ